MLADRRLLRWPTEPQWKTIWLAANAKGYKDGVSVAVQAVAPDLLDSDWVGMMKSEHRDVMWSEIRLRRSVAPFRKAAETASFFNPDAKQDTAAAFQKHVAEYVSRRWEVISDGPTGVQIRAPRKLKVLDLICFIIGLPMIVFNGLGLILVGLGLIDHFILTKTETKFLARP